MMEEMETELKHLDTPCFIVDECRVQRNCEAMRSKATLKGLHLRPHQKTHKTRELALLMCGGNKNNGIVVSTIAEAEYFADNGFDDILYAYPVSVHGLRRCQILSSKLSSFHLTIDNMKILSHLNDAPPVKDQRSCSWSIFLYINAGYRREGIPWDSEEIEKIAQRIVEMPNIKLTGVYTHCGQSYSTTQKQELRNVAGEACHRMSQVQKRLSAMGLFNDLIVSTGSTPSCSVLSEEDDFHLINEIHPGNYVFYDWQQLTLGACEENEIACWVMSRIVGIYPSQNLMLIDCGFTGLSHDRAENVKEIGFARIVGYPELKLESFTQELGKVTNTKAIDTPVDFSQFHLGQILFLQPWHSCATAAMHGVYHLIRLARDEDIHENCLRQAVIHPCRGW